LSSGKRPTEIGLIPEEWRVRELGECIDSDSPICYGILMPGDHHHGGVPVIKVKNVIDGRIDEAALLHTHPTIDEAYKRSRLASGDVLITIRGTTGRVAIVPSSLTGANITQDTARLRLSRSASPEYLYYALQSLPSQRQIALHTIGQAVKGINIRDVRRVVIPYPATLVEQRAIAETLSDADGLLAGLDRLIVKKRDLKQAAMQQLLTGQTRLPGFTGEWANSELWRLVQTPITDGPHMTPRFLSAGVPFLSVNNLIDNRIDLTDLRYISMADDEVFSRKCKPRSGDVLLGKGRVPAHGVSPQPGES